MDKQSFKQVLKIDRSKWAARRFTASYTVRQSALYDPETTMSCCLGIAGLQMGVTKEQLCGKASTEIGYFNQSSRYVPIQFGDGLAADLAWHGIATPAEVYSRRGHGANPQLNTFFKSFVTVESRANKLDGPINNDFAVAMMGINDDNDLSDESREELISIGFNLDMSPFLGVEFVGEYAEPLIPKFSDPKERDSNFASAHNYHHGRLMTVKQLHEGLPEIQRRRLRERLALKGGML